MKLARVFTPVQDDLKAVESFVSDNIKELTSRYIRGSRLPLSFSPVDHLFSSRGKSLRPALLILASGAASPEAKTRSVAVHRAAGVIELIHSASLIHDDVIDESPLRRAIASVHGKYGVKVAILAGDILFSHSFSILSTLPDSGEAVRIDLFNRFAELAKQMCFGEMLEQKYAKGTDSLDEYIRIINLKTAQLFATSCVTGAILTGGTDEQISSAERFGYEFGLAYQLVDDHIDGDTIFTGKGDLLDEARKHLDNAKSCLATIGANGHGNVDRGSNDANPQIAADYPSSNRFVKSMFDLCDWMMEQA